MKPLLDSGSEIDSEEGEDEEGFVSRAPVRLTCDVLDDDVEEIGHDCSQTTEEEEDVSIDLIDTEVSERDVRNVHKRTENGSVRPRENYTWTDDFSSFSGQKETYLRTPGPTFSSQDPIDIFCEVWDREFMETIVKETNEYAWQHIAQFSDPDLGLKMPVYLKCWTEVTVEELYRFFAILIYQSHCLRSSIQEYWDTGVLGMPGFRVIMSRNRFYLIDKFLHFVSNDKLTSTGYERKIKKIGPVVEHCNRKFRSMYTPCQFLSLDESLLLWKGRLSFKQCIRSKAARFGIKSFELCEAETGYLLNYRLYVGKRESFHSEPLHGFNQTPAKVVVDLMDRYLDVGHVLVMDNWYNQLDLTRYLKSRQTDVLGTLNRRRVGLPDVLRDVLPRHVPRGTAVARHCGDIAVVNWLDVKLVTIMSTYHQHQMEEGRRSGRPIQKPIAVKDYNRYMGGVDLKDQRLSMFLLERVRNRKWYKKVFKKLLNTSISNSYLIYLWNPMYRVKSFREFRIKIAEALLIRFPNVAHQPPRPIQTLVSRLQPGLHFPVYTDRSARSKPGRNRQRKRLRCVRCYILRKRTEVAQKCKECKVALCFDKCWVDYHTLSDLSK